MQAQAKSAKVCLCQYSQLVVIQDNVSLENLQLYLNSHCTDPLHLAGFNYQTFVHLSLQRPPGHSTTICIHQTLRLCQIILLHSGWLFAWLLTCLGIQDTDQTVSLKFLIIGLFDHRFIFLENLYKS